MQVCTSTLRHLVNLRPPQPWVVEWMKPESGNSFQVVWQLEVIDLMPVESNFPISTFMFGTQLAPRSEPRVISSLLEIFTAVREHEVEVGTICPCSALANQWDLLSPACGNDLCSSRKSSGSSLPSRRLDSRNINSECSLTGQPPFFTVSRLAAAETSCRGRKNCDASYLNASPHA